MMVRKARPSDVPDGEWAADGALLGVAALVLQPGFMVVRSSVPMSSAGTLLMSSAPG